MFAQMTEISHHLLKMMLKITFPRILHIQTPKRMMWMLGSLKTFICERKGKRFKNRKRPGPFWYFSVVSWVIFKAYFILGQARQTCLFPVLHLIMLGPYSCCPGPYCKVLYGMVLQWRGRNFAPSFSMGYAWVYDSSQEKSLPWHYREVPQEAAVSLEANLHVIYSTGVFWRLGSTSSFCFS